jgi:hypothetical protein
MVEDNQTITIQTDEDNVIATIDDMVYVSSNGIQDEQTTIQATICEGDVCRGEEIIITVEDETVVYRENES